MMAALAILALQACQPNVDDYTYLVVEGVTPARTWSDGSCEVAVVADSVTEFIVSGKGLHDSNITLESIQINGNQLHFEEPGDSLSSPIVRGEWGEVEYLTPTPPYTLRFRIEPNPGPQARTINFIFGNMHGYSYVTIFQPAMLPVSSIDTPNDALPVSLF